MARAGLLALAPTGRRRSDYPEDDGFADGAPGEPDPGRESGRVRRRDRESGGFQGGEFAYQTANAVVYFIVIVVFSIVQLRILRRREVSA